MSSVTRFFKRPAFAMGWFLWLGLVALGTAQAGREVPSGFRTALLVGNSTYGGFTLHGVEQSLDKVEQQLKNARFRVVRRENLGEKELKSVVEEFARSVPTNGVVLVYYAGLGAHTERFGKWDNLLRPVGEKIESDSDYRSRGLHVADVVELLREQSGSRLNLLFLDACWTSPLLPDKGNVQGGLRAFEVPSGTAVMFAAGSGQTVPAEQEGTPSQFAKALASHVETLEDSVRKTCEAIAAGTNQAWFGGAMEQGIGAPPARPLVDTPDKGHSAGTAFVNSIGMTFCWCPPGRFLMGSEETGRSATRDRQPVEVTLTQGFWMGQHEVTQREYRAVRNRNVPPGFTTDKNAPFWGVAEAKHVTDFCKRLNDLERKVGRLPSGWEYVCPTEAQWEYSCRAGSADAYCFGNSVAQLGRYGNFADKALRAANPDYYWADERSEDGVGEDLAPVGSYRPNAWGLCDMHGNVAELVADHLLPELPGGTDPLARAEKDGKTQIRGGAWCSLPLYCESSFRNVLAGRDKRNYVGFRIALKKVK